MENGQQAYLVADTRERNVQGSISTLFTAAGAAFGVDQINTGDYLICRQRDDGQREILACIERKTLPDFASSITDGRYENRLKMLDLRDRTGCQLYFFVEGPAFPKPTRRFSRIPYGTILSAMTNLMIRDGICVVQTEDEMGTAQRLLDFVRSFTKTPVPFEFPTKEAVGGGTPAPLTFNALGTPDIVLGLIVKCDRVLAAEVWARLPGVTIVSGQSLVDTMCVADLVAGRVRVADVEGLRTATGKPLVKKGRTSMKNLRLGRRGECMKVLSGVPGISPTIAACVLDTGGGLATLLDAPVSVLAAVMIQQKGRAVCLGMNRAARIFKLLKYTESGAAAGGAAGAAADGAVAAGSVAAAGGVAAGGAREPVDFDAADMELASLLAEM